MWNLFSVNLYLTEKNGQQLDENDLGEITDTALQVSLQSVM